MSRGSRRPANPLSLIDSAAAGAAFSDVAVVSAETVTVTTMPASTSETEAISEFQRYVLLPH